MLHVAEKGLVKWINSAGKTEIRYFSVKALFKQEQEFHRCALYYYGRFFYFVFKDICGEEDLELEISRSVSVSAVWLCLEVVSESISF